VPWHPVFVQFFPIFEDVYHWSPLMSAVRFLPITGLSTVLAIFGSNYASRLIEYLDPKWTLFIALLFDIVASLLLPFADQRSRSVWLGLYSKPKRC
jgi:MFS-type transporter involved in bile tolerance (Atg22 family)